MMHLSRFSEEIILWCSQEFKFIELDDTYATKRDMILAKKNPDMAELIRGKTGRVYGSLIGLLTIMKGLPLAYNKDLQEDKEGMFDTVKTVEGSLEIFAGMIKTMTVNQNMMKKATEQDFSNATELADYLAKKECRSEMRTKSSESSSIRVLKKGFTSAAFRLKNSKRRSGLFEEDVYVVLDPHHAVEKRMSEGGTGFKKVEEALQKAKQKLNNF